jgi:putative ABC transport system permease protein
MAPRQTIAMVVTSVTGIGLLGGAVGVPIHIALHDAVVPVMGQAAGTPSRSTTSPSTTRPCSFR